MFEKQSAATILTMLVVLATIGSATAAVVTAQQDAYAGTHVSFEATDEAIVDYGVDGTVLLDAVSAESRESAERRGGLQAGVDIASVTEIRGSGLSVDAESETRVEVRTDGGAEIESHDSDRGHLVVTATGENQLVGVDVASDAEARQEGDGRVVVTNGDGAQGSFIVIGEGEVVVNEDGDVVAEIEDGSRLVYRQYEGERSSDDREQESMIQDGTAAAEVYVTASTEGGQQTAADVVSYGNDTTVQIVSRSEGEVRMSAERAEHEGRVIITSVSEEALRSADEFEVTVDGEAATEVSSYSDLRAAANDGDGPAFMVNQGSTIESNADILVAVDHFSKREVTVRSVDGSNDGGDSDGDSGDGDETESFAEQPGFGVLVALMALAAFVAGRRR